MTNDLATRLKGLRISRLWTLKQMARVCDLDIRTIWNLENGRVKPHDITLEKIKRALPSLFEEISA